MSRGCPMRYILLLCPAAILGFHDSILFSIDYFRERGVPHVCLVNCENDLHWSKEFAVSAANHSIAVSGFATSSIGWRQDMQKCVLQRYTNVGVVMKSDCGTIEDVLLVASENMWFDSQHIWLIIDKNEPNMTKNYNNLTSFDPNGTNASNAIQIMEKLNISVNADVKMVIRKGTLQYTIYDIYNFGKVQGGTLKVMDAGSWNVSSRFSADLNENKFYRRWDFEQWPLRVVSVATIPPTDFDPSILTSEVAVPGVSVVTRTSTIILTVLAEVHNIKLVHTLADRWIGTFERNNATIASDSLYFREQDVTPVLRFSTPVSYKIGFIHPTLTSLETRYYYRIPTTGPGKYENQFLRPLSVGAWQSTVAMSLLCMVILIAAAKLEQRPSSVQYAVFSVTANICQQFFEDESLTGRSSVARKLTQFITGLSCVLIYNYYTSSVVSWLLNGPPPSITSLQELMESPLDLIYQDVGYTRSWLSSSGTYYYNKINSEIEDKIRRKILTKKKGTILIPLEEGIAMVKAGGYAYHTETDDADRLIAKTFNTDDLCELGSLKSMEKTLLYPGVQKDSPYKEFLTWGYLHHSDPINLCFSVYGLGRDRCAALLKPGRFTRLLERGIVSCVQRRTVALPVSCDGSSPRALALGGAAPAFIMLAFSFLVSTAIMFLERCHYKMKNKYNGFKRPKY